MTAQELLEKLPVIGRKSHVMDDDESTKREFVVTNCRYPNGDLINIYIVNIKDSVLLSDFGSTMYYLAVDGLDLSSVQIGEVMHRMAVAHEARLTLDEISIVVDKPEEIAQAALNLLQAIISISTLHYQDRS